MARYRTAPDPTEVGWPAGVPYIIGNEGCERFSFYGMKSILLVYLIFLYTEQGLDTEGAGQRATAVVHFFIMGVYALPMVGAILADRLLGKYWTILLLSLVYCAGHAVLALFEGNVQGIYTGLALVAVGSGGIKPCVSAHVGDQFGPGNWDKLERVFQLFYFIINLGSFSSTLAIPIVKEHLGWSVAFAIPGVLMAIATLVFWMGRHRFVHVPPSPGGMLGLLDFVAGSLMFLAVGSLFVTASLPWPVMVGVSVGCLVAGIAVYRARQRRRRDEGFLAATLGLVRTAMRRGGGAPPAVGARAVEEARAVWRIASLFVFIVAFWALFDQHATSWVRQAGLMDRQVHVPVLGSFVVLPEQMPAANPILVLLLIPFTALGLYPALERLGVRMGPLRRMTVGMFVAALAFGVVAWLQMGLEAGLAVHVGWQLVPYVLITLAEVMVSVTGLELAYSQAPLRMKSAVMGLWLLAVALGNLLAGLVAALGELSMVQSFWAFTGLMAAAGLGFAVAARSYRYQDHPQGAP
jgi:proton-dependent oligopeptide transporter, POT family